MKRMMIVGLMMIGVVFLLFGRDLFKFHQINKYDAKIASMSEKEIEKHFIDYQKKADSLGVTYSNYYNKININKIKEFRDLGIDITKSQPIVGSPVYNRFALSGEALQYGPFLNKNYFESDIIAVASVNDILKAPSNIYKDEVVFDTLTHFQIIEFIKGGYYYEDFKTKPMINLYSYDEHKLKKGDKVILFFSIKHDPIGNYRAFYEVFEDSEVMWNNRIDYITNLCWIVYDQDEDLNSYLNRYTENNLDSVVLYLKKLESINETKEFFKESFK